VLDFERGDVTPPWTVKHIGELYGISQPTAARWMHLLAELFELDRNADSHWVHRFT